MLKHLLAGCALALAIGGGASAAPLIPGAQINPATLQTFGGTQVATTSGNVSTNKWTASYTSSVYSGDTTNVLGGLDFVYQFTSLTGDAIERFTADGFAGFLTNAGFSTGPVGGTQQLGDINPLVIDRSSGTGDVVGFDFTGQGDVTNGQKSAFLVVQTNAKSYIQGDVSLQDGQAASGVGFSPKVVSAAPEPGAWALMLGGVGVLGGVLRMQRRRRGSLFSAV